MIFNSGTVAKSAKRATGPFTSPIAIVMPRQKALAFQFMSPCQK